MFKIVGKETVDKMFKQETPIDDNQDFNLKRNIIKRLNINTDPILENMFKPKTEKYVKKRNSEKSSCQIQC